MKSKILTILFFLFLTSEAFAYKNYIFNSKEKIKISVSQKDRLLKYLQGSYYSYSEKKNVKYVAPMVFAISEDGSTSLIISCSSIMSFDCDLGVNIYQMISKIKKKTDKNLKLIFIEDRFLVNNVKLKNKSDLNSFFTNYFVTLNTKINENIFFDQILFETEIEKPGD